MKPIQKVGLLLFAGGVQFVIMLVIAEAVYPGYSIAHNYISDLGVWSHRSAYIFNPSVLILGALAVAAALMARSVMPKIPSLLLLTSGIGAIGVGIFNEQIMIPHMVFAGMAFVGSGFAAFSLVQHLKSPFNYISAILGGGTLLAMVLLVTGNYLGSGGGGLERMVLYPAITFAIGLGGYLMAEGT